MYKVKQTALIIAMAVGATSLIAGCSSRKAELGQSSTNTSAEAEENISSKMVMEKIGYNPSNYVVLANNYKHLPVTVTGDYKVTNKKITEGMNTYFQSYPEYKKTSDKKVDKGDVANIDYSGTIKGKKFEGGSAKDHFLEIGSNSFITGFESGLKGHKVGETVVLHLKFPKNYNSANLAGKKVTFKAKINYIAKKKNITTKNVTDAYVKKNFKSAGVTTVKDFKAMIQKQLEDSAKAQKKSDVQSAVLAKLSRDCKVQVPDAMIQSQVESQEEQLESAAKSANLSVEKYIKQNYGQTKSEYEKSQEESIKSRLSQELILQTIAVTDKVSFSKADMNKEADQNASQYGYSDRKSFYKAYGGEDSFLIYYAELKALDSVSDGAKVTVKQASNSFQ